MSTYGQFSEDGYEYVINTTRTPRQWYNYMWNENYISLVSQTGQGQAFSQDKLGNRQQAVLERMCFISDTATGDYWNINGLTPSDDYSCTHGMGYSVIKQTKNGIISSFRVFVPEEQKCEIWTVTLSNQSDQKTTLRLFSHVQPGMASESTPQAYYSVDASFNKTLNAAIASTPENMPEREHNYLLSDQTVNGYDTRYDSFIGTGTGQNPNAVVDGACRNSENREDRAVLALQSDIALQPQESITIHIITGNADSLEEIERVRATFLSNQASIENEFATIKNQIIAQIDNGDFSTPDDTLNTFASIWLKRQISLGIQWARVRHNGFRDQIQDISAYASINSEEATKQLKRVLAYQYPAGNAPRTWINGEILLKDFSDNHSWIAQAVYDVVAESGDVSLLEEIIDYNDGTSGSIYEHVKRSVDYMWQDRGMFGLSLLHSGDWNDCLEIAGSQGKGVSIWLSMAYCVAADYAKKLALAFGKDEDAQELTKHINEMRSNIADHAWDGDYYVRAYDDNGNVIGSHTNDQATLFLNSQSWAVLAQVPRAEQALNYAEAKLNRDLGIISVENAFNKFDGTVGHMSTKLPGVGENGGVYLHSSTFKLVADAILGKNELVEEGIKKILPFDHTYFKLDCEPYVFCNSYLAIENTYRYGTTGQSWGTGTAGWFYKALLNYVYGLKPEIKGLKIKPCLPPSWKACSLKYNFRGATYHFEFIQGQSKGTTVDGTAVDPNDFLPCESGKEYKVTIHV